MTELCRDNDLTSQVIDDWMISALAALELSATDRGLMESILMWWLGFGDPAAEEPLLTTREVRISVQQTQKLRQQKLALAALRASSASPLPSNRSPS